MNNNNKNVKSQWQPGNQPPIVSATKPPLALFFLQVARNSLKFEYCTSRNLLKTEKPLKKKKKEAAADRRKIGSSFITGVRSQDINLESEAEMPATLRWIIQAAETHTRTLALEFLRIPAVLKASSALYEALARYGT